MKINYNNQDLQIINRNRGCSCCSCAFGSNNYIAPCMLFCRFGKIWIKDIYNSDIFRL